MKKLLLSITAFLLPFVILLSSCAGVEGQKSDGTKENTSETTATATAIATNATTVATNETTVATTTGEPAETVHTHIYGEWVTKLEATCQRMGLRERSCQCGEQEWETVERIQHHYVDGICTLCKQSDTAEFVPDYQPGQENTVGSEDPLLHYTAQGGYVYFSNEHRICKMKRDGKDLQTVYSVLGGTPCNLNVVGDWIYFYCMGSTQAQSYIAKVRTDGSGFEKLVTSVRIWEMLVAKDIIYYTVITENMSYKDYAKEWFVLYSVSVNGGIQKQVHDGAVTELNADATYLYFLYSTEEDAISLCRIKHGSTSKAELLQNNQLRGLTLENGRLYFFLKDRYDVLAPMTLASIASNGGGYKTHGQLDCSYMPFQVIGSKAYFVGSAAFADSEEYYDADFGLIEYDLNAKTFRCIYNNEDFSMEFAGAFDLLIWETYDSMYEKIESIGIYDSKTGTVKQIKLS
ncbi:MAG: DUF5050 domain-containing protein [Clostridia bacterium]|nr:DUF5050 domain-containing protein [Clostridia bacterium]